MYGTHLRWIAALSRSLQIVTSDVYLRCFETSYGAIDTLYWSGRVWGSKSCLYSLYVMICKQHFHFIGYCSRFSRPDHPLWHKWAWEVFPYHFLKRLNTLNDTLDDSFDRAETIWLIRLQKCIGPRRNVHRFVPAVTLDLNDQLEVSLVFFLSVTEFNPLFSNKLKNHTIGLLIHVMQPCNYFTN